MKKIVLLSYKIMIISGLVFMISLNSCKEEELNTFSGVVTDMSSGQPVAGVKVSLYASVVSSTSISSAFNYIIETTTDANGNYYFECETNSYLKFRIRYEKEGFHSLVDDFDPEDQIAQYTSNQPFARESYIYVKVHNQSPNNDDDQFKIRIERINEECTNCCSGEFHYYNGAYTDTSFLCSTVGGDSVLIYSISIHNEETQIRENKVYCQPGDTVFYNAYY